MLFCILSVQQHDIILNENFQSIHISIIVEPHVHQERNNLSQRCELHVNALSSERKTPVKSQRPFGGELAHDSMVGMSGVAINPTRSQTTHQQTRAM